MAGVPNRIREFRLKKGMTADELARAIKTTQGTISRLEAGRQTISLDWIYKIAAVLGVSATDLLEEDPAVTYALVEGDIRRGPPFDMFPPDKRYYIPVPLFFADLQGELLTAFETGERSWIVGRRVSSAVNQPGQTVIVYVSVDAKATPIVGHELPTLSRRTTERGSQGMGYVTLEGPADERWLHFADPRVKMVWLAVGEWKRL
jgi:transcriptional regulator with XRE-family HTH domain